MGGQKANNGRTVIVKYNNILQDNFWVANRSQCIVEQNELRSMFLKKKNYFEKWHVFQQNIKGII